MDLAGCNLFRSAQKHIEQQSLSCVWADFANGDVQMQLLSRLVQIGAIILYYDFIFSRALKTIALIHSDFKCSALYSMFVNQSNYENMF